MRFWLHVSLRGLHIYLRNSRTCHINEVLYFDLFDVNYCVLCPYSDFLTSITSNIDVFVVYLVVFNLTNQYRVSAHTTAIFTRASYGQHLQIFFLHQILISISTLHFILHHTPLLTIRSKLTSKWQHIAKIPLTTSMLKSSKTLKMKNTNWKCNFFFTSW